MVFGECETVSTVFFNEITYYRYSSIMYCDIATDNDVMVECPFFMHERFFQPPSLIFVTFLHYVFKMP